MSCRHARKDQDIKLTINPTLQQTPPQTQLHCKPKTPTAPKSRFNTPRPSHPTTPPAVDEKQARSALDEKERSDGEGRRQRSHRITTAIGIRTVTINRNHHRCWGKNGGLW